MFRVCVGAPHDHCQVQCFIRRLHRTQKGVILTFYYSETIQIKISKEKRCIGKSPEKNRRKFPVFPTNGVNMASAKFS